MSHPLVFVRKADQVIVVILPFQSVRVQFIEITAMFENSFFLGRIFIILELDLSLFQDRRLDGINDVIDLLIVRFHPAGQAGELPKLPDNAMMRMFLNPMPINSLLTLLGEGGKKIAQFMVDEYAKLSK